MGDDRGSGKIRVFFAIGHLGGGGAERAVIRILRHMDRSRFRPFLVVFEREGVFLEDVPEDIPLLDCRRRRGGGGRLRWILNFAGFIRRENPDIIMSMMWFANVVAFLARALSRVPCRLVFSEHSTIVGSREGFLTEALRRMAMRTVYRSAERVVTVSESIGRQFVDLFDFPREKIVSIPNPLEVEAIRRAADEEIAGEEGSAGGCPIVAGVGRLSREKGFDLLIRAARIARVPYLLLLVGEGREEGALRALAEDLGISSRVRFAGFQRNPFALLRRASVFALPSRNEGFPNCLVEAMALGLPCVATRCPTGPEEIITDGVDGLLVPVEDPQALAGAIDRLLMDGPLRTRIAGAACGRARNFDAVRIIRRLESVLEEALDPRPRETVAGHG